MLRFLRARGVGGASAALGGVLSAARVCVKSGGTAAAGAVAFKEKHCVQSACLLLRTVLGTEVLCFPSVLQALAQFFKADKFDVFLSFTGPRIN